MAELIPLEDLPITDLEAVDPGLDAERVQQAAALWQALEDDRRAPPAETLGALSGLLDEDLARAGRAITALAPGDRRKLVSALSSATVDDFRLDFSAVFRLALEDDDGETRALALAGLDETEDPRLVPVFVRVLRDDGHEPARCAAADGLAKYVLLGELEKIRPTPFHTAVEALRTCYLDEGAPIQLRSRALRAVAYTEEPDIPDLIASAYAAADETMRISAVHAMGRSAREVWASTVKRELTSASPDMRLEATRACGELQLADTVDDIAALADDVDQRIRLTAVWALGQIGGKAARIALQGYTSSDDEAMRQAAEQALQELEFFSGNLTDFFAPGGAAEEPEGAVWQLPGYIEGEEET